MASDDMLADQFREFLRSCDPETAAQIMSVLIERPTAPTAPPGMAARGSTITKIEKKQTRKKVKSDLDTGGPKRPLNSWMAFRQYYNKMLSPRTQKVISKLLTLLWRADPFEAKWAILAKAYSIVRGCREKKDAPLDEFMDLCAPLVGVIPPDQYLGLMGWQLSPQEGDDMPQITRVFTPDLEAFPEEFTTTTLSVDDLVAHCYAMGYVNASNVGSQNANTQGSLTMVSKPSAIMSDDRDETTHMTPFAQANTIFALPAGTPDQTLLDNPAPSPSSPTTDVDPSPLMVAPPAGQMTLEQATIALAETGAEYPYNALFDPTSQFDVNFDPAATNTAVEDGGRWDAFDPNMMMPLDEALNVRFEDFINDEGLY